MKKIIFIALLFLIAFASCEKESSYANRGNGAPENYHVSFTVDGVNKTFTGYVLAHSDTVSGYVTLTILGANTVSSFGDYMGIYLANFPNKGNITTGQYDDKSTDFTVLTTYAKTAIEYEAGQSVADEAVANSVTIAHHFKVNITAMDKKTAKGTFSGDYYQDGDVQAGTKLNITNGDFYVKFQ